MPPRVPLRNPFICRRCRERLFNRTGVRRLSTSAHLSASPRKSADADDYYALLLSQPLPTSAVTKRPQKAPSSSPPPASQDATSAVTLTASQTSQPPPDDLASRARLVFGSRDAGPVAREKRREERNAQATVLGGVRIPPRPKEPDNCCMSGCVNCVWDLYREELEEWAEKRQEAEMKMFGGETTQKGRQRVTGGGIVEGARGMDDDGGGSEANWDASEARLPRNKDFFQSVPVEIREFMKTEKRLNRKRQEKEAVSEA